MLLLLLGDEVLAVFQALDLELVALGSLVDVLDIVCEWCQRKCLVLTANGCLPVVDSKWLDAS